MNDTKKIGRPKKFDEKAALQIAVEVFWSKGYDGASMKDLTSAMGINSPSLYATYGSKETLFIKTIEHYMNFGSCTPLEVFEQESDITAAVRGFFEAIIVYATEQESGTRGCFLGSCVATSAETVDGVKSLLQKSTLESEERITKRFEKAIKEGGLPQGFPSNQRARFMFDIRQGPLYRARSGMSSESIRADIEFWVDVVLAEA